MSNLWTPENEARKRDRLIQSLFDFLSHLETGEVEAKLRKWTTMNPEQIGEVSADIDTFYDIAYENGMRPRKMRRTLLRNIIHTGMRVKTLARK